jgi:DNA repair protein RadC
MSRSATNSLFMETVGDQRVVMEWYFSLCRKLSHNELSAYEHAHFHPSGDPTPSPEDMEITRQLVEAGKLLDIELLDHLVIGNPRYTSLKELMQW